MISYDVYPMPAQVVNPPQAVTEEVVLEEVVLEEVYVDTPYGVERERIPV